MRISFSSNLIPLEIVNGLKRGGIRSSSLIMDLDNRMSIAYVMNNMRTQPIEESRQNKYTSDSRGNRLVQKIYEIL